MNKPFYTPAAQADLISILEYIAQDKPRASVDWIDKIEAKCLLLSEQPESGELRPKLGDRVRSSVVGRYVILYRPSDDRIEILRVVAGDRNLADF